MLARESLDIDTQFLIQSHRPSKLVNPPSQWNSCSLAMNPLPLNANNQYWAWTVSQTVRQHIGDANNLILTICARDECHLIGVDT
jgi:hypothetical protein